MSVMEKFHLGDTHTQTSADEIFPKNKWTFLSGKVVNPSSYARDANWNILPKTAFLPNNTWFLNDFLLTERGVLQTSCCCICDECVGRDKGLLAPLKGGGGRWGKWEAGGLPCFCSRHTPTGLAIACISPWIICPCFLIVPIFRISS